MSGLTFRVPWITYTTGITEPFPTSEWLISNGLGGYASATLTGYVSRRYHGLLIAAFERPSIRWFMLSHLEERLKLPDDSWFHFGMSKPSADDPDTDPNRKGITEFRLTMGLPTWRFDLGDAILEKEIVMPYGQNTTVIRFRLLEAKRPVVLELQPLVGFRDHGMNVEASIQPGMYSIKAERNCYEVRDQRGDPPLRIKLAAAKARFREAERITTVEYGWEKRRGYHALCNLWTPGPFVLELEPGSSADFTASAEDWSAIDALEDADVFQVERQRRQQLLERAHPKTRTPHGEQLVLAADQFVVKSKLRPLGMAAEHPEMAMSTIVAGYHWFADWGRDTMISLEGLTLLTGRFAEARSILVAFANYIRDGLVPNCFPDGAREAVYYTVDASLWMFHAVERYLEITKDRALLEELLDPLRSIIEHYQQGTRFGIGVDPSDGLVYQSDSNHPLTWMDAKVGDWIVTPRRGKPVEINALWYNALCLMGHWLRSLGNVRAARELAYEAQRVWHSFNDRFWYEQGQHLYDIVEGESGDDQLCRPNQIFSLAFRYPVLDPHHWQPVFENVRNCLLTPYGLRTLSPGSPGYQAVYFGDLRARDAAYHQGTVWPWLLGPYVDAWLRVYPGDRRIAHELLKTTMRSFGSACIGTLSEVHDAEEPYTPRGCISQAWSVAEILRLYVLTADTSNAADLER